MCIISIILIINKNCFQYTRVGTNNKNYKIKLYGDELYAIVMGFSIGPQLMCLIYLLNIDYDTNSVNGWNLSRQYIMKIMIAFLVDIR